jgi:MoxR-like ATPase
MVNIRHIEDVKAVAVGILRHRIIKNYKADAEGVTEEIIIENCYSNLVVLNFNI